MKNYSFSIVIPVYNVEKYIGEMIDSVCNQTYDNWELILIDDGSTDNSGRICDTYASDKVKVIHNRNMGQVAARMDGIRHASKEYTVVLDSDDYYHPECLERVNRILNEKEYDMVIYPYDICDENLVSSGQLTHFPEKTGEMDREDLLKWIIETTSHGLVDKVTKTELIKKGIESVPDRRVKINGDYILVIPIAVLVKNAYFFEEPMYKYRVLKTSASHNYCIQHLIDTDFVSRSVVDSLRNGGVFNEKYAELVNVAYLRMIAFLTECIIAKHRIGYRDFDEIRKSEFFRQSVRYEKRKYFNVTGYIELILLRRFPILVVPFVKFIRLLKKKE